MATSSGRWLAYAASAPSLRTSIQLIVLKSGGDAIRIDPSGQIAVVGVLRRAALRVGRPREPFQGVVVEGSRLDRSGTAFPLLTGSEIPDADIPICLFVYSSVQRIQLAHFWRIEAGHVLG